MLVTVCVLGVLFRSAVAALTTCADVSATAKHLDVTHTLCQPQSPSASTPILSLTADEKDEIVNYHNVIRRNVAVASTNMLQMEWCNDLANLAEKWASVCIEGNDEKLARFLYGKTSVGQNTAMHPGETKLTWTNVMAEWAAGSQHFTYGVDAATGVNVGHYTQMIWATTHTIGCSYAQCSNPGEPPVHRYVCNYGPSGNCFTSMKTPYKNGTQASDCRANNNGICDCTGTKCFNDGTLDPSDCSCTCVNADNPRPPTSATGIDCRTLSCNNDKGFCDREGVGACFWTWKYCGIFCNWCPKDDLVSRNVPIPIPTIP